MCRWAGRLADVHDESTEVVPRQVKFQGQVMLMTGDVNNKQQQQEAGEAENTKQKKQ